ncbi:MAG TPA: hypothetical protein VFE16_05240 [Candidatus Cybelea sp.]|jgi:hypothetical protein|nr:hypothetical protein [Candidatus Cybelea sp.]
MFDSLFGREKGRSGMNEIGRVWDRLKDRAAAYAEHDLVVDPVDSRAIVAQILREERTATPPAAALDFLASELVRLTAEAHDRLQHPLLPP